MKYLIYLLLSLILISCKSYDCINAYTKQELDKNTNENIVSIINKRKLNKREILKTYKGVIRGNYTTRAKAYNQLDYDYLKQKYYNNDTLLKSFNKDFIALERLKNQGKPYNKKEYKTVKRKTERDIKNWSKKQIKKIGFDISSKNDKNKNNENVIYEYSISEPVFTQNDDKALFVVSIYRRNTNSFDDFVIIMEKINNKWLFLEKVQSTNLH